MLAYVTRPVQARLQEHVVSPYLRSPTSSALHLPPRWDLSVRGGRGFGALRRVCGTDRRARDRAAALRPPSVAPGRLVGHGCRPVVGLVGVAAGVPTVIVTINVSAQLGLAWGQEVRVAVIS